jgi:uncharacterized protein YbbC (DUF1343 family)
MKRMLAILLLTVVLMGLCISAYAQETREATFLSQTLQKWSNVSGICIQDNYAYLAVETGLSILDISDTTNPQEVGFLFNPDGFRGIAMLGNYAYLLADDGLYVADVSNPYHCFIVNTVTQIYGSPFSPRYMQRQNDYLYISIYLNHQNYALTILI